jgi:hypothetical protein
MTIDPAPAVWGKNPATAYPLAAHLLDTALVIGALWDSWLRPGLREQITDAIAPGDPGTARRLVTLVAALHDVGKANPLFQFQDSDSRHLAWREGLAASLADVGLASTPAAVVSHARSDWDSPARRHEYVGFRAVAGEYPKQATHDFVRAQTEAGEPCDPRNALRALKVAAERASLPGVGLHTLRHSAATVMSENRVPLKVVSEILGHFSVSITGDIYGHVSPDVSAQAMDALGAALDG